MSILSERVSDSLRKLYSLIAERDILWILSGSVSLSIQGVDVSVNDDIDILTDKKGSERINELLSDFRVEDLKYSETEKYRSYFGKYLIDGIRVEVMGEFQYRLSDGGWSEPNQNHKIFEKEFLGMFLPLLSLNQERKEYQSLGRNDTAKKIGELLA